MTRKRTKIVSTLGPASSTRETISSMIDAGMDVARLNFSHGTLDEKARAIELVREVSAGRPVAILQDLGGPKLRLGPLTSEAVVLDAGRSVLVSPGEGPGNSEHLYVNYPFITEDVQPGNSIFIDDGRIELRVRGREGDLLECEVISGGEVRARRGVNLRGTPLRLPSLTEKDFSDLEFGMSHGVDLVALSFVRSAADIESVRRVISERRVRIQVIAKIERPEALERIDEILKAADGVMVARGDLGIEIPPEQVPLAQKDILASARRLGRFSITATQMLESMVENPRPTRAETSDVANAILDGTDAIMLSAETSIGRYPLEAVRTMATIAEKTEGGLPELVHAPRPSWKGQTPSGEEGIAQAACALASELGLATIVCFTMSGLTARLIAVNRPTARVVALTPRQETWRQLAIIWGVQPYLTEDVDSTDRMLELASSVLLEKGLARPGETVVLTAGIPVRTEGITNLIKLHHVGGDSAGR